MSNLSIFGVDYAWGAKDYEALKSMGVKFAMRYVSHDASKDLSRPECQELWKRGIAVGLVFETVAKRALAGKTAGAEDARFAKARCETLGIGEGPANFPGPRIPVYFAVDWDVTPGEKAAVASYLRGAASVLGRDRTGVYGGYHVIKYVADRDVCDWFWQTYAWSGGLVHPKTHIYQYRNGQRIGQTNCDFNKATTASGGFGVYLPGAPIRKPSAQVRRWKRIVVALKRALRHYRRLIRRSRA